MGGDRCVWEYCGLDSPVPPVPPVEGTAPSTSVATASALQSEPAPSQKPHPVSWLSWLIDTE
jgi:hypothetical protein